MASSSHLQNVLLVLTGIWLSGFCLAENGVNVPVVSSCHKTISESSQGKVKSHDGFPNTPYATGYQCRFVIHVPTGQRAEVTIGGAGAGLRPWDFAILLDGRVANKLNFICDVNRYKTLGNSGEDYLAVVQKYMIGGSSRTIKSSTSTVVVDFCAHTFDKELSNRKGFEISYSSTAASQSLSDPDAQAVPHSAPSADPPVPPSNAGNLSVLARGTCGRPQNPPSNNPNNRIVNGVEARPNSWPWICTLVQRPTTQFCGCTLIAEQWIVTAGHCIDGMPEYQMKQIIQVYLGVENLQLATDAHKYDVVQVIKHERYNEPAGSTSNDIALIRLDRPVPLSHDAMPACLPTRTVHAGPYVQSGTNGRRICYVAGWGRLSEGQDAAEGGKIGAGSDRLQQVAIEVMSASTCKAYMAGYNIMDTAFCGGYDNGKYDSCQGDSGGPLMCDDGTGKWSLFGIVSWGLGCAQAKAPGIYTNVAMMRDWITQKMNLIP